MALMARIRSVKPEICESETMAQCSAEVERTFVRLWTHCDDHGRAKDDPRLIKAALFPLHDTVTVEDVDAHLSVLAGKGLIVRYEVDGKRFLACPSWSEHQHPQRARTSKIPEPPAFVADVYATPPVPDTDVSGPVVVGVEVEGDVVGEVDEEVPPTTISGDVPVPPEPVAEPVVVDQEQEARRALRLYADAESVTAENPTRHAAAVGKAAATDGRLDTLRTWIAAGMTPEAAAVQLGRSGPLGPVTATVGPAEAERIRERARRAEEATHAAIEADRTATPGDHRAHLAAIRGGRS